MIKIKILFVACFVFLTSCSKVGLIKSKYEILNIEKSSQPFSLTLYGGGALNRSEQGVARPVQICIYVVKGRKWFPPLVKEQSTCMEKTLESNLIFTSRILLAPHEARLVDLDLNFKDDCWIVLDADFSKPSNDYAPYYFEIKKRNLNLVVHIDGNKIL